MTVTPVPKVSGAVQAGGSGPNAGLYTAPANGYAIINVSVSTTATIVTVNTQQVPIFAGFHAGAAGGCSTIYVGPGQVVAVTSGGGWDFTGVEFTNS